MTWWWWVGWFSHFALINGRFIVVMARLVMVMVMVTITINSCYYGCSYYLLVVDEHFHDVQVHPLSLCLPSLVLI